MLRSILCVAVVVVVPVALVGIVAKVVCECRHVRAAIRDTATSSGRPTVAVVYRLPKVPLDLHWHFPCVQKWPHIQRRPGQHWAYFILASGRQKSPHLAHQFRLKKSKIRNDSSMSTFNAMDEGRALSQRKSP